MNGEALDCWASWIAQKRYGGDVTYFQQLQSALRVVADRIIKNADLRTDSIVLDVGTGDGVIGARVLALLGSKGRVVFSDISSDVLALCKEALSQVSNAEFVLTKGETLEGIGDRSVDTVVWRAVLPYSDQKAAFFESAYRVLNRGGRISFAEPINQFSARLSPPDVFFGFDCEPISAIIKKIKAIYINSNPGMSSYSDVDLFREVMAAGFLNVQMETVSSFENRGMHPSWDAFMSIAPNPKAPPLFEAIKEVLTLGEKEMFVNYMRPIVETRGSTRLFSQTYIHAQKE